MLDTAADRRMRLPNSEAAELFLVVAGVPTGLLGFKAYRF